MEIALAVLLVLSFPIIAIAGLVIAIGARERVRVLEQRFAEIQKGRTIAAAASRAPELPETPATPAAAIPYPRADSACRTGRHCAPARCAAARAGPPRPPPRQCRRPRPRHHRRPPQPHRRWASKNASAPNGRSGSAASRSRSAASSWCAIRSSRAGSGPAMRVVPRRAARARADRRRRMGAPQGKARRHLRPADRTHPEHPDRRRHRRRLCRRLRRVRALPFHRRRPAPSSCSAWSRSRRSPPRCCTARRWRGSAWSAPMSRRCSSRPDSPNFWALYLYLAVVTAAAFMLARVRMWRWLAITAVGVRRVLDVAGPRRLQFSVRSASRAHAFHVVVGFALAATLIVSGLLFGPDAEPGKIDPVSSAGARRLSVRRAADRAGEPARPARADRVRRPHRGNGRDRLAQRGRGRRPCRRRRDGRADVLANTRSASASNTSCCRPGRWRARCRSRNTLFYGTASCAWRRACGAVRRSPVSSRRAVRRKRWCRRSGRHRRCSRRSRSWSRSTTASPSSSHRCRSPGSRCCWPHCSRSPPKR